MTLNGKSYKTGYFNPSFLRLIWVHKSTKHTIKDTYWRQWDYVNSKLCAGIIIIIIIFVSISLGFDDQHIIMLMIRKIQKGSLCNIHFYPINLILYFFLNYCYFYFLSDVLDNAFVQHSSLSLSVLSFFFFWVKKW